MSESALNQAPLTYKFPNSKCKCMIADYVRIAQKSQLFSGSGSNVISIMQRFQHDVYVETCQPVEVSPLRI